MDDEGDRHAEDQRESFPLDGGAPFYRAYETSDGRHTAVGSIEPAIFAERFASRTRDEWTAVFAGTDACVTPVLTWNEAADDVHLTARSTIVEVSGVAQAAPAPRFSRTPSGPIGTPPQVNTTVEDVGW